MEEKLNSLCDKFRISIKNVGNEIKSLMYHGDFKSEQTYGGQHEEMKANIMLAYRHLEDARMRVGKILQAADGGVSVYDKIENDK